MARAKRTRVRGTHATPKSAKSALTRPITVTLSPGAILTVTAPAVPDETWLTRPQAVDSLCRRIAHWRTHRNAARMFIARSVQGGRLHPAADGRISPREWDSFCWSVWERDRNYDD